MIRGLLIAAVLLFVMPLGICQNIYLNQLKDAYAKSGEIGYVNGSLAIAPMMPCPPLAFPVGGSGKDIRWDLLVFPTSHVLADLRMIDETSIEELHAFSVNDIGTYKVGDQGGLTIVVIKATSGKPFWVAEYDFDKLKAALQTGAKHITGTEIGESREYRDRFSLIFENLSDARKFETALKNAAIVAKAEPSTK